MKRAWSVLVSLACVVLTMQVVPAQEPIKIGVIGPHSGPAAFDGQSTLIGAQVAAEELNKAGGLLGGRKIELVPADSRGIPAEARRLAEHRLAAVNSAHAEIRAELAKV